ncbi:DUF3862 domain-containing protein [Patescibacteria group bacterium]|nr:DUF3862 domain-containing protein [Patescibacteria group bacterium]
MKKLLIILGLLFICFYIGSLYTELNMYKTQSGNPAKSETNPNIENTLPNQEPKSSPTLKVSPKPKASSKPVEKKATGVSLDQFNRLQEGMSYQEVVAILGSPGELQSSQDLAGYKTVMYMWKGNSLMGNLTAIFQNDKMIQRSQFALQ